MVYRRWPWRRSQSRSAEPGRPSKFDADLVGERAGLAGQDETGLTILGFEDIARRHVDITGDDGAHARAAVSFAARVGHVDTLREQHVDERRLPWPSDAMPIPVEFHFSYGHAGHCRGEFADGSGERPMFGRDELDRPLTGKESAVPGRNAYGARCDP
jgi:hypothetical protein